MMPKEKTQLNSWARGFNRSRVLSAKEMLLLESAFYQYQTAETVPCPKEELTHFQSVWKCQRMSSGYHFLFSIGFLCRWRVSCRNEAQEAQVLLLTGP